MATNDARRPAARESAEASGLDYGVPGSAGGEVELLQRAKQEEIDLTGDPEWREQLRRELEAEIDRRVREALDTPPGERHRRSRELARLKAAAQREREFTQLRSSLDTAGFTESGVRFYQQQQQQQQQPIYLQQRTHFRAIATPFEATSPSAAAAATSAPPSLNGIGSQVVRERFHGNARRQLDRGGGEDDDCEEDEEDDEFEDEFAEQQQQLAFPLISSRQLTCLDPQQQLQLRLMQQQHRQQYGYESQHAISSLRRGLEAMRNFGDLSQEERLLLFSNFTRDAFRQALATAGRLPDGSALVAQGDGRYRDQYGILRDRHGPFWPVDFGPCHPAPRHQRLPSPDIEPLLLPMKNPGSEPLVTADTQRTEYFGRWRGTQIVYDSERCPRHYSPPVVAEGVCPSLVFESRFESGNLRQVRRVGMFEYELVLRTDLYTKRHTQWFYFRVQNAQPGVHYKFVIVNLLKPTSLYGEGMKPLLYSEKAAASGGLGWHRAGHHIRYSRNVTRLQSALLHREMPYYQLEWQMDFPHPDDVSYLAHCYPYTYSDLREDLLAIQRDAQRRRYVREEALCETNAGNTCFLLTITEPGDEANSKVEKCGAVVTARVHPGEANSSWMMKGLIDFLTGESPTAAALRKHFVFKLVPMLNPDGVIVGNYRTSLAARDLNRNYRHPRPEAFPTVFHTKRMLEKLQAERRVALYCDLHGHSRKSNVFMYGCDSQYKGVEAEQVNSVKLSLNPSGFLNERLFPWLMSRCSPDLFSYRGCKFNIRRCKEATGRVVVWRQFGIENSFTMEATFSGTSAAACDSRHFNTKDLESMGHSLATALWQYKQVKEDPARQAQVVVDMTFDLVIGLLKEKGGPGAAAGDRGDLGAAATADSAARPDRQALVDSLRASLGRRDDQTAGGSRGQARVSPSRVMEQLSLKSVDDCSSLLRQLDIDSFNESDSSDSDSESDPELPPPPPPPPLPAHAGHSDQPSKKRKRKSKKKDANGKKREAKDADAVKRREKLEENEQNDECEDAASAGRKAAADKSAAAPTDDVTSANSRAKVRQFPMFVSKFEGRSNNGIPCFSEERLLERANRKIYSLHSRLNQEKGRDIIYSVDSLGPLPSPSAAIGQSVFSHVDELPRDSETSLASLEEIRYRLQHLLAASQDVQEEDSTASGVGDSGEAQPAMMQQLQQQATLGQHPTLTRQQLLQQQNFTVVRPAQSLRPAKMLQRRRSLTHFGRAAAGAGSFGTAASLVFDQSLSGSLGQPHQVQPLSLGTPDSALVQQTPPEMPAGPAASSGTSATSLVSISRSRTLRLPHLRERHNRMP